LSNENPWGIMRFLEESKYNNLPRVKRFKTRILIEPSLKMLPLKFACAKMWAYWRIHQWLWYFIWKILTGESHQKHLLYPAILSIQQRAKYSSYSFVS
jgi:hypothetical protein